MRIGFGYDIHKLVLQRKLVLGGVEIPFRKGLLGHSDADVLVHAIIDALLGAVTGQNIGMLFPDTDAAFKGISSTELLKKVVERISEETITIHNIDSTVILEKPRLNEYIPQMQNLLAACLQIKGSQISIKPKTNEQIGPIGREEAIAAYAVALVSVD